MFKFRKRFQVESNNEGTRPAWVASASSRTAARGPPTDGNPRLMFIVPSEYIV